MPRRVVDVMSEMWPEVADSLESFEGFSTGLNASGGASRTRAVLWIAPTFIAIGREKPGIGHRVVVDRFAVSEIVNVTGQEPPAGGLDETPTRSHVPRPRAGSTSTRGASGRLVIKTRRGDIDFTADAGDRGPTRSAYEAIVELVGRR